MFNVLRTGLKEVGRHGEEEQDYGGNRAGDPDENLPKESPVPSARGMAFSLSFGERPADIVVFDL